MMIVITGATGQLGSRIMAGLLERMPADQLGVSVRDPGRAGALAARGVRVRRGDYDDPGSLTDAFEGADQVLVVSGSVVGEQAVAQHVAAIDAARAAGASRILYTSHQAANPDSRFGPARDHAATEAHLVGTGTPFTSLRDGFHATSLGFLIGDAATRGELVAPADGPVSWTTHDDLAAAAVAVLTGPPRPEHDFAVLTGAEAVDMTEVAAMLSDLTGRDVRRVVVSDDEYVAHLVGQGVPEPGARMFLTMFDAARAGEFDVVDPTLRQLIGREPQSVRTVLAAAVGG